MNAVLQGKLLQEMEEVLAALLLASVWLVPNHQLPWTAFHHELLISLFLGLLLVLLGWKSRLNLKAPAFGVILLALCVLPWIQYSVGLLPKVGTAFISSAYVAAVGVSVMIGYSLKGAEANRLFAVVMLALIIAGLMNVPIQLAQWFQWYSSDISSWGSLLVTPIDSHQRPSGSILQPNLLATLQIWALLGLTWLLHERRLRFAVFLLAFITLIIGLGLTQSRVGMLEMALCFFFLCWFVRHWSGVPVCVTWGLMSLLLLAWSLNFQYVAEQLGVSGASIGRLGTVDSARIDAWKAFLLAVWQEPLWGYGLTDVGYPYILGAQAHPEIYIGVRFAQAHNLILDIFLWIGLPLGCMLLAAALLWGWRRLQDVRNQPELVIPLLVLLTLTLHAMLELPHQYLYLLVPAGLCVGIICGACNSRSMVQLGRSGTYGAAACVFGAALLVALDYFSYQESYTEWRFDSAKIGIPVNSPLKKPLVLNQLHDELVLYRMDYSKPLTEGQLRWMEETVRATTSGPAIFYMAFAYAIAGEYRESEKWMMRYNSIIPSEHADHIRRSWATYQQQYPQLASIGWPPYLGRRSRLILGSEPVEP